MRKDGIIQAKAKSLRRHQTEAEKHVWAFLRSSRMSGIKFRRQHAIDPYIVDFVCLAKKVIIELDGGQHNEDVDKMRTQYLERQGFTVLRFWNNDVISNREGAFAVIERAFYTQPPHPPAATSPARGEV